MAQEDDKIKALYNGVSKDYDVGTFDEFSKKLADPTKRKAFYDGVGKEYNLGKYDEFERKLGKPSEVSTKGSKNTSGTSTEPSRISQQANPFGAPTQTVPTINVATGKTGTTKVTTGTKKPKASFVENIGDAAIAGLGQLGTIASSIPSGLIDTYGKMNPTNQGLVGGLGILGDWIKDIKTTDNDNLAIQYLGRMVNGTKELKQSVPNVVDAEQFGKITEKYTGLPEEFNPLSPNNKAVEYFAEVQKSNHDKANANYKGGIWKAIQDGEYSTAGKLATLGAVESLPLMLGLVASRGAGLSGNQALVALGVGTTEAEYQQLKEQDPNIDKNILLMNAQLTGLGEAGSELVGTNLLYDQAKNLFKRGLKDEAEKLIKTGLKSYIQNAFKKSFIGSSAVSDASGEGINQVWKNAVDKWSGVDPERDYTDGVMDAVIVSMVSSGGLATGAKALSKIVNPKIKQEVKEQTAQIGDLSTDVDNTLLPEQTREELLKQTVKNTEKVNNKIDKEFENFNQLTETDQKKVVSINDKLDVIDEALTAEGITPTTKTTLEEQKVKLEEQLSEIKPPKVENVEITPTENIQAIPATENVEKVNAPVQVDNKVTEGVKTQPEYFNQYKTAVEGSSNVKEAFDKAVNLTENKVLSDTFKKQYNPDGTLTPEQTFERFYNSVKSIDETFENTKALTDVGTKEEYESYVENVFPESKNKTIYYHGSKSQFDEFNLENISKNSGDRGLFGEGIYLSPDKAVSENYGDKNYKVVVNVKNTFTKTAENFEKLYQKLKHLNIPKHVFDGQALAMITQRKGVSTDEVTQAIKDLGFDSAVNWTELVVFDPKNVHILGSKNDIENFKRYKNGEPIITPEVSGIKKSLVPQEVVEKVEPVVKPKFTIKGETVTPKIEVVDVANPVVPEQTEELVQKKRTSVQRVLKSSEYSQAFKDSLGEQTISYTELPNKITERDAQAFIDINGEAETIKSLYDFNNGIKSSVRFTVMQKLIDNYEEAGDYVKAGELAQELYSKGTDYGQGIQIFSTFPKLSRQSQIAIAEKNATNQREISKKRAKPTTDKIVKDFKEINKQTAEEVVAKVTKKVDEVLNTKPTVSDVAPKDYGSKNKIVTKDKYKEALKNLRKKSFAFAGGVPLGDLAVIAGYHLEASSRDFATFSKRMVSDVGTKIKPYLKELYAEQRDLQVKEGAVATNYLTDKEIDGYLGEQDGTAWKKKFDQAVKKTDVKSEKLKSEAIAKLQQISKEEGLWGKYKESAATRLKGVVKTNIQKELRENPSLEQFTTDLVRNMRAKMIELLPETTKKKSTPTPDLEVLADAYKNFEKYEDVWQATQEQFKERFADQPEVLENLDRYFGEILDKPFNEKLINRTVNKGLKDMGKNINDLIVQHYTVLDGTRQDLADKLVEQAGLTGTQAKALSDAVQKEFDRIATQKKQQALEKIFSKKERRKPAVKTLEGDIIKMSNLGAFTNNDIVEMYGDKMGWAKLTDEQRQKIGELADIVQNTKDSIAKRRATEDLLAYQALLKGNSTMDLVTSIWYANVLSGYNTQIVNFGANAINTALLYANAVARNPTSGVFLARGLAGGLKRGFLEAKETLSTGYSPIKGAPEVPTLLELKSFVGGMKNPLNWLKYVRRVMIAADVIFFEGQKEMRAYQLAKQRASNEGKIEPTLDQMNRAIEILGRTDGQMLAIDERVELEYQDEISRIDGSSLTPKEKSELRKLAESDKKRKKFDYIEQERPTDLVEETATYAARGTYNYKPQGALGAFANGINNIVADLPILRYAVPFTNIIANVANETIDYTPVGFIRRAEANIGGGVLSFMGANFRREPLTANEKADLTTKAVIGTTLMGITMLLSQVGVGDDDEPLLEITSNGTGDFTKNEILRGTGWQPYSFRVKKPNGKYSSWISYQYSPLIAGLGFVGHFNDLTTYKEEKDEETVTTKLSKAAGLNVSTFFQSTYLAGLGDFLQSVLDPRSSEATLEKAVKGGANAVKGVVIPNLATQITQSYERIFDVPKKEVRNTLLGNVVQDIPFARNSYGDKVNILGDPIMYDTDKFFSVNKPDTIVQLLVDKKSVFAPPSRKAEKTYDIETGKERMLNDEEFYIFARTKGQAIKTELEERFGELDKLSVGAFKKELTKIKTQATKDARAKISTGESSLFEIKGKEDGKNVTFKLTPQLVKERLKLNEEYIKTEGKKELQLYIDEYVNLDKLPLKKATEKAKLDIQKNANKYSANVFLDRIEAGKLTLDIKE